MTRSRKTIQRKPRLSIIGAGSVGTAFARALHARGYPIVSIISSDISKAQRLARDVKAPVASSSFRDLSAQSDVVFITTPDESIGASAIKLAEENRLDFPSIVFLHTSGALGSHALFALAEKGGHVLSLHPIQVFPRTAKPADLAKRLEGIFFSVEGDPAAVAVGKKIVRDLGGKALPIREELKPLYHIACVVASNYLVALLSLLDEVYAKLGLDKKNFMEVFENLILSTVEAVKGSSPREALTGPIERGDVETVRLHLSELRRALPYLIPFYTILGMETIRLAAKKGTLSPRKTSHLIDTLGGYLRREVPSELLSHIHEHKN